MNKLFQQLLQQAARKAPVGFGPAVQRVTSVARDVTNPAIYQQLAKQAERTLGGALPPQFSGANFGNIPARAVGLISDLAAMPMGMARTARAIPTSGAIREMAQSAPRVPASIQQAASGALRAPVIGDAINAGRNIATGLTGGLVSPTGFGGPFARDPGLRREFLKQLGGSSQKAAESLSRSQVNPSIASPGVNPSAIGGLFRNLDNVSGALNRIQDNIPTAVNPFRTATPTTLLGKAGKFFNPLNPMNAGALATGAAISTFVPEDNPLKGNLELLTSIPGGPLSKLAGTLVFGASGTAPGTLDAVSSRSQIKDEGGKIGQKNEAGQYWAGRDYGYQSPESFNKLYGTRLPSGLMDRSASTPPGAQAPSAPVLPPSSGGSSNAFVPAGSSAFSGQQAGRIAPPAPTLPSGPGVVSNGAGVPAQRQNVQNRALSQEVLNAAQQYAAPTGIPLSSFYEGQQQLGRSMEQTGELQRQLKELGGAAGMTDQALMTWAQKNPGLAYREIQKLKARSAQ